MSFGRFGESFKKLSGAKQTREGVIKSAQAQQVQLGSKISSAEKAISDIATQIEKSKEKTMFWADKAEKLLSEKAGIEEKYPIRSGGLGRAIKSMTGVGARAGVANLARGFVGKALPPMQVFSAISQAVQGYSDPAKFIADSIGIDMPSKGTKERAVVEKFVGQSTGVVDKNQPTPEELGVTPEEEWEIMNKYGMAI